MKVDTVSSANSAKGNVGAARKLADNSALKNAGQNALHTQPNNRVVKTPNQDGSRLQLAKSLTHDDQQSQLNNQEREKVEKALKVINLAYKEVNVECKYSFDDRTNIEVVTIINSETGETIRQYPPEDILNMIHKMYDMYGILMDEKV